jgi:predicted nucleic acid-binding protein
VNSPISESRKQFFIDTSYLVALIDETDLHHGKAKNRLVNLPLPDSHSVFLSDIVINETANVLSRRCRQKRVPERIPLILECLRQTLPEYPILCLYDALKENYGNILSLMTEREGRLSFHDCLIALFLKEVPDVKFVSFDEEFEKLGWLDILN